MIKSYPIAPVAKPRMVYSDRYKKRPTTTKYWKFKDEVRRAGVRLPESGFSVLFVIPMPESWPKKKKIEMNGQPHQQKKDLDNLLKALLDAIYKEDCVVWDVRVSKIWGYSGSINIGECNGKSMFRPGM